MERNPPTLPSGMQHHDWSPDTASPSGKTHSRCSPSSTDDARLLEQLQRDPRVGIGLLHDRFAVEVNRLVWRLLGADPDHDDLVQQVFIQLLTKADRVRDAQRLGAWVRAVTFNLVCTELRKRRVRRSFAQHLPERETSFDGRSSLEHRELLRRCLDILDGMPDNERLVFVLRYVEGYELAEVAGASGCSLATVKRRIEGARRRLSRLAASFSDDRRSVCGTPRSRVVLGSSAQIGVSNCSLRGPMPVE